MLALTPPLPQFFDLDGTPLDQGFVNFGSPNANPQSSPKQVYWDAAGTNPAVQPLRTLNGYIARNGSPAVVYIDGDFSLEILSKNGRLVIYAPSSSGGALQALLASGDGAGAVAYKYPATGSVVQTLDKILGEGGPTLTGFGGKGDGVANASTALASALAAPGKVVTVPPGTYLVSNGTVGAAGKIVRMEPGANFKAVGGDGALDIPVGGGLIGYNEGADKDVWYHGRRMTGAHAVGVGAFNDGFSPCGFMFDLRSDDVDSGSSFTKALNSRHRFGGSNATGGKLAIYGVVEHADGPTNANNLNRNYVGVTGSAYSMTADGGTAGNEKGGYFGLAGGAYADNDSQYLLDLCGAELNTFIGTNAGTIKYASCLSVSGVNSQRGTVIDCAIRLSGQAGTNATYTGHIGWSSGFTWTNANGADPIAQTGSLMDSYWTTPGKRNIARGFDLSGFNITSEVLRSGDYMKLTNDHLYLADTAGFATIEPNGPSTNANLLLRARGTGKVAIGNVTATADTAVTGYITVSDYAGNFFKIAVINP